MNISLSEAGLNKRCVIEEIDAPMDEKLRLYDFGFMPESCVVPMYVSFLKGTRAYMVKDTLIALRRECSDKISVRICDE